jgi:hypothetical protein
MERLLVYSETAMKELFRERDPSRVGYYQSLLEASGIQTHVRNRDLVTTMGLEVPIPEFFPALCVVDDEDYDAAIEFLREVAEDDSPVPEELPFEAKGIFVLGVCLICCLLILAGGALLLDGSAGGDRLERFVLKGFASVLALGGVAGIWRVLVSYRQTKLRENR